MILILFVTTIYVFFNTVMISREVLSFQDFTNINKVKRNVTKCEGKIQQSPMDTFTLKFTLIQVVLKINLCV